MSKFPVFFVRNKHNDQGIQFQIIGIQSCIKIPVCYTFICLNGIFFNTIVNQDVFLPFNGISFSFRLFSLKFSSIYNVKLQMLNTQTCERLLKENGA